MEGVHQGSEVALHMSQKRPEEQTHLNIWFHTAPADKLQRIKCQELKICKLQKIITCLTAILNTLKISCFCDLEAAEHQQLLSLGTLRRHFQLKLLLTATQDKLWLSVKMDQRHQPTGCQHTQPLLILFLWGEEKRLRFSFPRW